MVNSVRGFVVKPLQLDVVVGPASGAVLFLRDISKQIGGEDGSLTVREG